MADLMENRQAEVATYSHDVAETKIAAIKQGRFGSRLNFDLKSQVAIKPRSGPI